VYNLLGGIYTFLYVLGLKFFGGMRMDRLRYTQYRYEKDVESLFLCLNGLLILANIVPYRTLAPVGIENLLRNFMCTNSSLIIYSYF